MCIKAVNTAQSVLRMIYTLFFYKTYVRPSLKYSGQAWSPEIVKDIEILEKVQQRATKWVRGLKNKHYTDRFIILNITTLEKRRKRGDLTEAYKIITGKEIFFLRDFKWSRSSRTPAQVINLQNTNSHHSSDLNSHYFFSQRVINDWNRLLSHVLEASSINPFKNRLDDYLADNGQLKRSPTTRHCRKNAVKLWTLLGQLLFMRHSCSVRAVRHAQLCDKIAGLVWTANQWHQSRQWAKADLW